MLPSPSPSVIIWCSRPGMFCYLDPPKACASLTASVTVTASVTSTSTTTATVTKTVSVTKTASRTATATMTPTVTISRTRSNSASPSFVPTSPYHLSPGLSAGGVAGVAVGVSIVVSAACCFGWCFFQRKKVCAMIPWFSCHNTYFSVHPRPVFRKYTGTFSFCSCSSTHGALACITLVYFALHFTSHVRVQALVVSRS